MGTCRYRFFAGASLQLSARLPPSFAASLQLLGSAMHKALELCLGALLHAEGGFAAQRSAPETALKLAHHTFARHLPTILPPHRVHPVLYVPLAEQVWRSVHTRLEADLAQTHVVPLALEYAFGRDGVAPLAVHEPEVAAGRTPRVAYVRGSVDRIDRTDGATQDGPWAPEDAAGPDGQGAPQARAPAGVAPARVRVLDYKRSARTRKPHRHLQLGLYGLVAARDFAGPGTALEMGWVGLTGANVAKGKALVLAGELTGSGAELTRTVAHDLWARLGPYLDGDVAPDSIEAKTCESCTYADLCQRTVDAEDDGADEDGEQET